MLPLDIVFRQADVGAHWRQADWLQFPLLLVADNQDIATNTDLPTRHCGVQTKDASAQAARVPLSQV